MCDYNLITKGLAEVVGDPILRKITDVRPLKVYWGTAPTGRIHIGYYTPLLKIAELVKAGCTVKILIADLHAMLDNLKSTEKQIHNRSDYYIMAIKAMLKTLQVDPDQVTFVKGTEFQLTPEYTMNMYRLNTMTTLSDAKHAGCEVVKQAKNPMMTGLLYPTLQALDEEHLQVDAQLGGIDQRKIFMFARDVLPKLGYKKRIHLLTPMVPGLRVAKTEDEESEAGGEGDDEDVGAGGEGDDEVTDQIEGKMSASNEKTKLDMLDTRGIVRKKVAGAYCLPNDITDNSVLDLLEKVLFPLLHHIEKKFEIFRREEHGGPIVYTGIDEVKEAFASGKLHPADLKEGVVHWLDIFIEPVRKEFETREWKQVLKHAYGVS